MNIRIGGICKIKQRKGVRIGKILLLAILVLIVAVVITVTMALKNIQEGSKIQELTTDHQSGVWYKYTPEGAIDSIGESWHGLIRFGTENKVVINFYGGGVSINEYIDKDGNQKILYHHVYSNFKLMMNEITKYVDNPKAVLVTGWSGGGFGASFRAEEIFTDYFPNAQSKTVLADAAFLLKDDWKDVAENIWGTPKHIANRFTSDHLVLDSLRS